MQSRYRSPRDGFRTGPPGISGGRISSYGRDPDRGLPNPYLFPRKLDILMEAGRLAAEYLESRGINLPEHLRKKFPSGSPPGFEPQAREIPQQSEVRTSALARLGQRFDDEGRFDSRRREKLRKRHGPYSRVYDSDWGRENGKHRNWMDRGRAYSNLADEEEEEFALGFGRNRRKGYSEIKSSVYRVCADEQPTRSESVSEKENFEFADDTLSKASSSSIKKDHQPEADEDSSKGAEEAKVSCSDIMEEVKSGKGDEPEKIEPMEEDNDSNVCKEESDADLKNCSDLLKLCSFTKVPTKPRSSLTNRSPKVQCDSVAEMSNAIDDFGDEKVEELNSEGSDSLEAQTPDNHSHVSDESLGEAVDSQPELFQNPLDSANCSEPLNEKYDTGFEHDIDESKNKDISSSSLVPHTIKHIESTLHDGKNAQDDEMDQETSEKGLDTSAFTPNIKRESIVMLEEESQHDASASFKICDLNLTGSPEMNEIPGGPAKDHVPSAPNIEMNKVVSADLNISMRNGASAFNNTQISGHIKVIPVIDLEEDSHADDNALDSSKHKNDISYPNLETVLNQATHTVDLPSIQDGYSLEFPEFLGTDMSGCPSAQGDLNDMQPEMGLHGTEGYSNVDDHIYVSLDELPIGFMGVWDQPSQDYGKFF